MIKAIHMFWSNWLTAEVMEVTSTRGVSYSLNVQRLYPDTGKIEPVMTVTAHELHDIQVVVNSALSLIEHLLDGGSHAAWCDRRGYLHPQIPGNPPQSAAEVIAEALQPSGQES